MSGRSYLKTRPTAAGWLSPARPVGPIESVATAGRAGEDHPGAIRWQVYLVGGLVVWMVLQDPVLSIVNQSISAPAARLLLLGKDVVAVLLFAGLLFATGVTRSPIVRASLLLGLLYLAFVAISALFAQGAETSAVLLSLRALSLPVVLFGIGVLLRPTKRELVWLVKLVFMVAGATIAVGAAEQLLLSSSVIWERVGLSSFLLDVKEVPPYWLRAPENLPHNFFFEAGGQTLRRLAGIAGSPLGTGYFLILPVVAAFGLIRFPSLRALFSTSAVPLAAVLGAGLLLTVTRGAILSSLFGIGLLLWFKAAQRDGRDRAATVFVAVVGLVLLLAVASPARTVVGQTLSGTDGSSPGHVAATEAGLERLPHVAYAGTGLGTAGAAAEASSPSAVYVGENSFLVIAVQIGIPGLLLFLAWAGGVLVELRHRAKRALRSDDRALFVVVFAATSATLISGVFSEQLLTFTSVAHVWIIAGAAVSMRASPGSASPAEAGSDS